MCNSEVILLGEITCLSVLGVKGLTISVNHLKHCRCRQHMIVTATGLWISLSVSFFTWGSFSVYPQFFSLTEFSFAFTLYYNWGGNDFWKLGNYEMEQSIQLNVWRARCTLEFNSDISSELRFSQQGTRHLTLRFEHCKNYEVSQSKHIINQLEARTVSLIFFSFLFFFLFSTVVMFERRASSFAPTNKFILIA